MTITKLLKESINMDWSLIMSVILIIIGFILVLIEVFLVPGLNIFGIVGFISILGGIIYSFQLGLGYAIPVILGSFALGIFIVQQAIRSRTWDRLILHDRESDEEGYLSAADNLDLLIEKEGYALTPLRPSGTAVIDGKRVDVVSEGIFIEKDAPIKVVDVEGTRVVVRPAY